MQEYIEKEAVMEVFKTAIELPWARLYFHDAIEALPTTVHHEYKIWERYEFSDSTGWWTSWILQGFKATLDIADQNHGYVITSAFIRPLQSEHPDIIQARELASKHWMILIPKE